MRLTPSQAQIHTINPRRAYAVNILHTVVAVISRQLLLLSVSILISTLSLPRTASFLPMAQPPRPQVQPCRYKTGKTLGAGSYSVVKECVHIDTGRYYAAKVINKRLMAGREHMVWHPANLRRPRGHDERLIESYLGSQ